MTTARQKLIARLIAGDKLYCDHLNGWHTSGLVATAEHPQGAFTGTGHWDARMCAALAAEKEIVQVWPRYERAYYKLACDLEEGDNLDPMKWEGDRAKAAALAPPPVCSEGPPPPRPRPGKNPKAAAEPAAPPPQKSEAPPTPADAGSVRCPVAYCGAEPGRKCADVTGKTRALYHDASKAAAKAPAAPKVGKGSVVRMDGKEYVVIGHDSFGWIYQPAKADRSPNKRASIVRLIAASVEVVGHYAGPL